MIVKRPDIGLDPMECSMYNYWYVEVLPEINNKLY